MPVDEAPTCGHCASSDFLVYENVTLLLDAARVQPASWDVEFWCGACESFGGMLTTHVPDDRQAARLAAENPRFVRYPATGEQPTTHTKVARSARRELAAASMLVPPASAGSVPGPATAARTLRGPGRIMNALQ